jgi:hypothetical protein
MGWDTIFEVAGEIFVTARGLKGKVGEVKLMEVKSG